MVNEESLPAKIVRWEKAAAGIFCGVVESRRARADWFEDGEV